MVSMSMGSSISVIHFLSPQSINIPKINKCKTGILYFYFLDQKSFLTKIKKNVNIIDALVIHNKILYISKNN